MKPHANPHERRHFQTMTALMCILTIACGWWFVPHPLIVVVAFAPLVILTGLQAPFLLCLAFIAFSFFRLHEVFPALYPLRIPQLLAIGTLGSLLANLSTGRLQMFWSRELSVFAIFFFIVVLGALLATNRAAAMGTLNGTYIKIAVMVFAISWLLQETRQFRLVLLTMVMSGVAVGSVALMNKANGLELVEGTRVTIGRSIGSMLGDPNDLSLVLLFPASFALAMLFTPGFGKLFRLLGITTFVVVIAAIIATQSRGGLLGICAVCGIFAWQRVENKAFLIGAGVALLSVLFVAAGVSDRASGGAHEEGIDESAMGRIYAWQAAFGMALHHPITGVGINNFISNYFDYSPHWDGQNHAVHSTWFGVMAETGIVGLGLFITMVLLIARIGIKTTLYFCPAKSGSAYQPVLYACAQSVQAGLAGFCVSGTFLTMGFTWPIYILLALAIALSQLTKRSSQPVSQNAKTDSTQNRKTK